MASEPAVPAPSRPWRSGWSCTRGVPTEIDDQQEEQHVPRALVTNDDGIDSPGLHALAAAARDAGLEVVVAAPAEQASGTSASLAAVQREGRTVVARRELPGLPDVPAWAVDAQPGHIVVAALN